MTSARHRRRRPSRRSPSAPSSTAAPVAFAAGVVLNIVPGTFPIVALKDIAQLNASDGAKLAVIVVFYVIMFAFVEIPIVAYLIAPERTTVAVNAFSAWLKRNGAASPPTSSAASAST